LANWLVGNGAVTNGSWRSRLYQHLDPWRGLSLRSYAYNGFRLLGSNGVPAIPKLQQLASKALPDDNYAVFLLTGLGAAAVPALTNALGANPYPGSRVQILSALGFIGSSSAVPVLITALRDADADVVCAAARNLGRIHQRPDISVPALLGAIEHSSLETQRAAIDALGEFGSDAKEAKATLETLRTHFVLGVDAQSALKKLQLPRVDMLEREALTGFYSNGLK
ncbi:MAG: hypothetical protein JWO95_154, partial [Verrucomicrobiales bacterium]|nr:hypothetical protein [Verrucomicrobiales bacterium]